MDFREKLEEKNLSVGEIATFMIDEGYQKVIADLEEYGELKNFTMEDYDNLSDAIYNLVMK